MLTATHLCKLYALFYLVVLQIPRGEGTIGGRVMWNMGEGTLEHHRWDSTRFHLLGVWCCLGGRTRAGAWRGRCCALKRPRGNVVGLPWLTLPRGPPCTLCVQGWVRGGPAGPCLSLYSCEHSLVHPSITPSFYSSCSETREHTQSWTPLLPLLSSVGFAHSQFSVSSILYHQLSSVAQLCPTLCDPMNCSMPGLPVHHQLLEFTQTNVHWVGDAIQPSHPLSSPSPPAPNPSQPQGLFQWVNSSQEVAKVLEFQL